MWKKFALISVAILLSNSLLLSQNKKLEKIISAFNNKDYQNTIKLGKKYLEKYQSPQVYYLIGLSYFHIGIQSPKPVGKIINLKNATAYIYQAQKLDKNNSWAKKYQTQLSAFHDSLNSIALYLLKYNYLDDAKFFSRSVATMFHDTTEVYKKLFIIPEQKEKHLRELAQRQNQPQSIIPENATINQTDAMGRRQGLWVKKYPNGNIKYIINFKNGHPAGLYRRYYPDGQLLVKMTFDPSGHRAKAIFYDEQGNKIAEGYYYDHKRDSVWKFFFNDSILIKKEYYKRGIKNGPEIVYSYYHYPNLLQERHWKNGKLDSVAVDFYYDGTPKSFSYYKNGVLDGPYTLLYYNGRTKIKGQYKNGYMDGKWLFFNPDGSVDTVVYKMGEPVSYNDTLAENKVLKAMTEAKGKYPEPEEMFEKQFGLQGNW